MVCARDETRKLMNTFESFDELKLPEALSDNLHKIGFINPTPVQAGTIPAALEGKDILGTAQTGTGKTGAFGIPLLANLFPHPQRQALILAPTRELAAQIDKVLRDMSHGLKMYGVLLVGGESFHRQHEEIRRGVDYIVATPGRLIDHLGEGTISLKKVHILVLDEVDRMLDMGFIPQVREIMKHVPATRQTMLFSATLPGEITNLVNSLLKDPVRVAIGPVLQTVGQVKEETLYTTNEGKFSILLREVSSREGRILVFARTKSRTEKVAKLLKKEGFSAGLLHGDRSQGQRKQALEAFRKGSSRILVATDLAGRGIDIADIEHVINFDVPGTREDYIHRVGRTGRFGKNGTALTLLVTGDLDGERIVTGTKLAPRKVFSSRRWGRR